MVKNSRQPHDRLLSLRSTVILLLAVLIGGVTCWLTRAAGRSTAEAVIAGGTAMGGAVLFFNQVIGQGSAE
jgi:hypothetical protein